MEKGNNKKNIPEINEELMMNLMVDGIKKEGLQLPQEEPETPIKPLQEKPLGKERNKGKKVNDQDYESIFFKKPGTNARDGKTVYIRPDFHEKLSRIVHVIGEDKITIYAYLDNLLEYHFQEFGEQITISFNDKYKPIL
ncbi:DUF3408 domain-containing protein [Flavobacterium taihuense]|uniref:DUF3408 domain-containing protein n=1 Tax=Flavobacterium taihuense TaxID=2857508 RepID=A0ABS6XXC7_9FLAO|nr:DUF3408 domain-containing protein [Flavobacterium taihuense]MBW4360513.1 DUF3408 domain-containing protein [Flavobacterium taihuense]